MTSSAIRIVGNMYQRKNATITSIKLSEEEEVTVPVIMKLMKGLQKSGIISSKQGRRDGGYSLKQRNQGVTLYDVIKAVEDDIVLYPKEEEEYYKNGTEALYHKMVEIHDIYIEELNSKTVKELIEE